MNTDLQELFNQDPRYKPEAYQFIFESLDYAQNRLKLGKKQESEPSEMRLSCEECKTEESQEAENHVTGQELCQASRLYALDMYGFMAKTVLNNWGIHSTSDFGELVYNMIRIGRMRKTLEDRREDFNDVYDFENAFDEDYRIKLKNKKPPRS